MPRRADALLQQRIEDAGLRLWRRGREKGLTMRAVAREAGTTTPTVYERFRNKRELLLALRRRVQQSLNERLRSSRSVREACRRYLEFVVNTPAESELLLTGRGKEERNADSLPNVEWMKQKLAQWVGGSPESHTTLVFSLWILLYGTATVLVNRSLNPRLSAELLKACESAVDVLVQQAHNVARKSVKRRRER